jgi:hypothetical protein
MRSPNVIGGVVSQNCTAPPVPDATRTGTGPTPSSSTSSFNPESPRRTKAVPTVG